MTLAPTDTRNVRSVLADRYPLNKTCSHPECDQPTADPHHCFRRSAIGGDSWFVEIDGAPPVPHVTGLCRPHHNEVTEHGAWIRLEDGVWNWYGRANEPPMSEDYRPLDAIDATWGLVGPLSPQPGSTEAAPKKRRKVESSEHETAPARKKAVKSIRVPKDEQEDGLEVLETLLEAARERLAPDMGWTETTPPYYVIVAVLHDWLTA